MMNVLLYPIHSMEAHRIRRKQTRTALQMLTVSGVIRPGHVELRYGTPIISVSSLRTTASAYKSPIANHLPSAQEQAHAESATLLAQWVCTLPTTIANLARKPIRLRWNTD